jgi:hypothetical protein
MAVARTFGSLAHQPICRVKYQGGVPWNDPNSWLCGAEGVNARVSLFSTATLPDRRHAFILTLKQ